MENTKNVRIWRKTSSYLEGKSQERQKVHFWIVLRKENIEHRIKNTEKGNHQESV